MKKDEEYARKRWKRKDAPQILTYAASANANSGFAKLGPTPFALYPAMSGALHCEHLGWKMLKVYTGYLTEFYTGGGKYAPLQIFLDSA